MLFSMYFLVFVLLDFHLCKKNNDIYCGACIALIDEMKNEIKNIDPKKLVHVGSFRVDGQGNQKLYEIPLGQSQSHLMELLEGVCTQMLNYGEARNGDGNLVYVRFNGRGGEQVSLNNIQIASHISDRLKFACEAVVEDCEEQLIPTLQSQAENVEELICHNLLEICNSRNITDFHQMNQQFFKSDDHPSLTNNLDEEL